MRFAAVIVFAVFVACFRSGDCLAQQGVQQPVEKAAPSSQTPVARPAPPAMVSPPSDDTGGRAPAHHSRSLQKAAPPAPAAASKPNSGTPDVVVGGLPGNQSGAAAEKQP